MNVSPVSAFAGGDFICGLFLGKLSYKSSLLEVKNLVGVSVGGAEEEDVIVSESRESAYASKDE